MKCVKCRAAVRSVDKSCSFCGARIAGVQPVEEAPRQTAPPSEPATVDFVERHRESDEGERSTAVGE